MHCWRSNTVRCQVVERLYIRLFQRHSNRPSPPYVRMLKTVLVQALNFAIEQGDRTDNPAEKVRIPAVTAKPGRSLSPEEAHSLIAACEGIGTALLFASG
jgi:hypothetical protein